MSRSDGLGAIGPGGDLELDQDLSFQRREWTIQRAGWLVMATLLVAGLLGLFGTGPLGTATAEAGPLQLQFARFERRHAPSELEVVVERTAVSQDQLEIWFAADYLAGTEITSVMPEPVEVRVTDDRLVYRFSVDDQARTHRILIALEYDELGVATPHMGLVDGPELTFWQFVYP